MDKMGSEQGAPQFMSYAEALEKQRLESDDSLVSELVEAGHLLRQHDIFELLRQLAERKGSDLHIKVGSPPGIRIDGQIHPVGDDALRPEDTRRMVHDILEEDQFARFADSGDLDLSYAIPEVSRFRVNALVQRGSMGLVVRRVPEFIPTLEDLEMPEVVTQLAERPRGLVLVTGPTGSGKSTTMASLVDHVNTTRRCHILTMEDPIEFTHKDQMSWVTQREIGSDSKDFPGALRRALRQDPDVIMVGEMRDLETIRLAVTAAETGHLVFATLHTTSAMQTVTRIVDVFPADQQQQIRLQLADTLQGVISQTLVPRRGKGRIAAIEILIATDGVRALIRDNKVPQLRNLLQTGSEHGMQTLEASLNSLVDQGLVTPEVAVQRANYPHRIQGADKVKPARMDRPPWEQDE